MVVAYMNTSGRVKALAGRTGGAVCTSSNAAAIMRWARAQGRRIFFVPDQHLGPQRRRRRSGSRRSASPCSRAATRARDVSTPELAKLDGAELILWGAFCGVHTIFKPRHVAYWRARGYSVVGAPRVPARGRRRSPTAAARRASSGSTCSTLRAGARFAVGTEGHFVRNLARAGGAARRRGRAPGRRARRRRRRAAAARPCRATIRRTWSRCSTCCARARAGPEPRAARRRGRRDHRRARAARRAGHARRSRATRGARSSA